MIEIADAARARLDKALKNNPGKYLRIAVEGDGCAGPYFRLFLDEAAASDIVARVDGFEILVSDHVQKIAEVNSIKIYLNADGDDLG